MTFHIFLYRGAGERERRAALNEGKTRWLGRENGHKPIGGVAMVGSRARRFGGLATRIANHYAARLLARRLMGFVPDKMWLMPK